MGQDFPTFGVIDTRTAKDSPFVVGRKKSSKKEEPIPPSEHSPLYIHEGSTVNGGRVPTGLDRKKVWDMMSSIILRLYLYMPGLQRCFSILDCAYYNCIGETVENCADSNGLIILFNEKDFKTFIHYGGGSKNPDLAMITPNVVNACRKFVLCDPGREHRMTLVTYTSEMNIYLSYPRPLWNFQKANWHGFSADFKNFVKNILLDASPYKLYSNFTEPLLKSAKMNILRGRSSKLKPFWNKEFPWQRKKRDAARMKAESTDVKSLEE
ncbi:hypothetical protein NPIL_603141 [Nephila pilipes]|uniref:Uncharacterized protein n=1 Tax=Nephila pilipes TaxID=299642 RepID=A0A8X6TJR8_NEPPI|nr:hypothetical protein NPIL_603141 [Nephila pilipes]